MLDKRWCSTKDDARQKMIGHCRLDPRGGGKSTIFHQTENANYAEIDYNFSDYAA
jgi:hypothetical protein